MCSTVQLWLPPDLFFRLLHCVLGICNDLSKLTDTQTQSMLHKRDANIIPSSDNTFREEHSPNMSILDIINDSAGQAAT